MSKIPEGATHTYTESTGTTYRKKVGDNWLGYADGDWIIWANPAYHCYVPIQAEPEWNGEGLPPVGIECEINHSVLGWVKCEIVAHKSFECGGKPYAIAWIDGNTLDQSQGIRFRKICTPEKIAAEKRDAAIKEMQRLVGSCNTFPFAELYDYGYRLQVEK